MSAEAQTPAWIEWLFNSGIGLGCLDSRYSPFRQDSAKQQIAEVLNSEKDGFQLLRIASLRELQSENESRVERALVYLMLVGRFEDIPAVDAVANHPCVTVRKGAKTCRFELSHRAEPEGCDGPQITMSGDTR